jgi:hypothetical protein
VTIETNTPSPVENWDPALTERFMALAPAHHGRVSIRAQHAVAGQPPAATKIVTRSVEPIDAVEQFGADADPAVVDAHVRKVMQAALDELASARRLPVVG